MECISRRGSGASAAALLSAALLFLATHATADDVIVHNGGGGMYETIQEGVDAAADGDIVLVLPGTYTGPGNEHIILFGKNITITSFGGPDETIISDAYITDHGGVFYVSTGTARSVIIEGFTFRDVTAVRHNGGAIHAHNSVITVRNCVFENCVATQDYEGGCGNGGAICLWGSQAAQSTIEDCTFVECQAQGSMGGAIYANNQAVAIARCSFVGCSCEWNGSTVAIYGSAVYGDTHSDVTDCTFWDNTALDDHDGGILYTYNGASLCDVLVSNCTFVANTTPRSVLFLYKGTTIEHCIIAFNTGGSSPYNVIDSTHPYTGPHTMQCAIFDNSHGDSLAGTHEDNLFVDPLLCGYPSGDLSLCADSPCLPDSPDSQWEVLIGALGQGCGDCTSPVTPMTWGAIKALYR